MKNMEDAKFPASERFRDMYRTIARVQTVSVHSGEAFSSTSARSKQSVYEFVVRAIESLQNRCYFFTKCGRMGIGALHTRKADVVCILFGSPYCFILRPFESRYKLVGEAYVQGVMGGELFNTDAPPVEEDFVIC
jgi:hypothetical protein